MTHRARHDPGSLCTSLVMPVGSGMRASAAVRTHHNHSPIAQHDHSEGNNSKLDLNRHSRSSSKEDGVLSVLPPPEERIFSGNMYKKSITSKGVHWLPRFAVLSHEHLAFAKVLEDCSGHAGHWMSRLGEISTNRLWEVFDKNDINKNGLLFHALIQHNRVFQTN